MATAVIILLALPSCGLLPSSHYSLTALPLSPEQGWVQLPTARWLVNPGIEPDTLMFCPRENCAQQAFVARIELNGPEAAFADRLISDPARILAMSTPTHRSRRAPPVSRADVSPITLGGWSGASVRLESRKAWSKSAHVALLARREGPRAWVMIAVAPTADAALQLLRLALD